MRMIAASLEAHHRIDPGREARHPHRRVEGDPQGLESVTLAALAVTVRSDHSRYNHKEHAMEQASVADHERLVALIGRWKTDGWTREIADAPAVKIDAVDTYEWLPGRFGLLHVVDAEMGDEKVEGAEIIGYDADRRTYATLYVGSDGSTAYEASLTQGGRGPHLEDAQQDDEVHGRIQPGRPRHHGTLGVAGRRRGLAALDGHHADQARQLIILRGTAGLPLICLAQMGCRDGSLRGLGGTRFPPSLRTP
jgi:hypothetical protein